MPEENSGNEKLEVCPACAKAGNRELKTVSIEKDGGKTVKKYLPCGHKHTTIRIVDSITLKGLAKVNPKTASSILKKRKKVSALFSSGYSVEKSKDE